MIDVMQNKNKLAGQYARRIKDHLKFGMIFIAVL